MKKLLLLTFLVGSAFVVFSQITLSNNSQIIVASGANLIVNDINNDNGTIEVSNGGTISVKGNIINNGGGLFESTSSGTITFNGSSAQEIGGTSTVHFYGSLGINNSNGVNITGTDQEIHGALTFTDGKITLNGFNLTLGTTDPTGVSATSYIATNGIGQLKRSVANSDVIFPVGNSTWNQLILNNTGASLTYGVRVVDNEPENLSTSHMVNRSWVVTQETAGNSNLAVTTQWNENEELTNFERTSSNVGLTTDGGTNYAWGTSGAASGSNPYTQTGTGFTDVGTFTIGDYYYSGIEVDVVAFLAGAYNSTTDKMDKSINSIIPLNDPYTLSTTVTNVPDNAVDWIKIELRDKDANTSVLYSFARFIDENGQIIEEDETNLTLKEVPKDSYYIALIHRNHFGVISNTAINLDSSPAIDFTNNLANAWDNSSITTNNAMKEVETGVFALWDGDANGDGVVSYNGGGNDRIIVLNKVGASTPGNTIIDTYAKEDVNMNGDVNYNGGGNDRISILNTVGASTPGNTISQHLPE